METELICTRTPKCGFRAYEEYFVDKKRFSPGICPNCGGPISVVEKGTDNIQSNLHVAMLDDPKHRPGSIIREVV